MEDSPLLTTAVLSVFYVLLLQDSVAKNSMNTADPHVL